MANATLALTIPAKIYSNDCAAYAEFDARAWFVTAPVEEVLELARNGWGGEHVADEVAKRVSATNSEVADVLQYVMYVRHGGRESGYKCVVDGVSALEWLAYRRPDVLATLRKSNPTAAAMMQRPGLAGGKPET